MSSTLLTIYEIKEKQVWENFVTLQLEHSFLHSWAWGEFNKSMGDKIWRLGVYEESELIAVVLLVKVHAKRGDFLFVPHGPIIENQKYNLKFKVLEILTKEFKKVAQEEKTSFVRISSLFKNIEENTQVFKKLQYRPAPIYMHAEVTWTLSLKESENDLMYGMRKNTRNLVRRAEKEGVKIEFSASPDALNEFMKLYKQTSRKHSFVPFSKRYIENEIKAFNQEKKCSVKIYLAKYSGQYISGAIIVFYGNSAYYHHGASGDSFSKIPASYLLQWEAIKDAKKENKEFYNFWGIAKNEDDKKHPWYGLSLFKKGFGGERKDYLHAQDLVISPLYWLSYAVDKARLWKRGV